VALARAGCVEEAGEHAAHAFLHRTFARCACRLFAFGSLGACAGLLLPAPPALLLRGIALGRRVGAAFFGVVVISAIGRVRGLCADVRRFGGRHVGLVGLGVVRSAFCAVWGARIGFNRLRGSRKGFAIFVHDVPVRRQL